MDRVTTQTRAGGQCEMFHQAAGGGRCGRSAAQEAHHIVKRSLGGGDEPENIAELCNYHHRCVERRQVAPGEWLYLTQMADGSAAYSTEKGGEPSWFLWPNVETKILERAEGLLHEATVAVNMRRQSAWLMLDVLLAMEEEGDLWQFTQYESFAGLANELEIAAPTMHRYLRLARQVGRLPEDQQARVREHPPTLFERAKLGALTEGDRESVLEMMEAPERDLDGLIEESRQLAQKAAAETNHRVTTELVMLAKAVTFCVTVDHDEADDPLEIAKRKIVGNRVIIDGGVEWQPDSAHTMTRV